jgi:hypothetical protein
VDNLGHLYRHPAVVLVSNNAYALGPRPVAGTRPALDSGRLGVVVLDAPSAGRSPARAWTATRLEVTAPAPIHAGIDGEAVELVPPLEFATRPAALRVRIAARHASRNAEARRP